MENLMKQILFLLSFQCKTVKIYKIWEASDIIVVILRNRLRDPYSNLGFHADSLEKGMNPSLLNMYLDSFYM